MDCGGPDLLRLLPQPSLPELEGPVAGPLLGSGLGWERIQFSGERGGGAGAAGPVLGRRA